jgi:uncharacterized protein YgiM (DUF1202 family)
VSYQPEERYWTDYLRIALPVVGLLLMLGLFWYWASAVIGDDSNNQPPATQPSNVALITDPTLTPTTQPQVALNPETAVPEPTPQPTQNSANPPADNNADQPTEGPTGTTGDQEAPGEGFKQGDTVVTNDSVNLREEPSVDAKLIQVLEAGVELEVLEEAVESGGYFWLHVQVSGTDTEGYLADQFVAEP